MPIYDNDNTVNYEISKLYDNDGVTDYQTDKVYDNDGSVDSLIYSAELYIFNEDTPADAGLTWTVDTDYSNSVAGASITNPQKSNSTNGNVNALAEITTNSIHLYNNNSTVGGNAATITSEFTVDFSNYSRLYIEYVVTYGSFTITFGGKTVTLNGNSWTRKTETIDISDSAGVTTFKVRLVQNNWEQKSAHCYIYKVKLE